MGNVKDNIRHWLKEISINLEMIRIRHAEIEDSIKEIKDEFSEIKALLGERIK